MITRTNTHLIFKEIDFLIHKYGTRDPFELCDRLNIRIHYKNLGTAVKAYYFYQSRVKNIILNNNSADIVKKVLCAHELGHALLHGKLNTMRGFQEIELFDTTTATEYEANLFAAELLIDDEELLEKLNTSDKSFFDVAKDLCVPAELLDFKFRLLKNKGYHIEPPCIAQPNFLKNCNFDEHGDFAES